MDLRKVFKMKAHWRIELKYDADGNWVVMAPSQSSWCDYLIRIHDSEWAMLGRKNFETILAKLRSQLAEVETEYNKIMALVQKLKLVNGIANRDLQVWDEMTWLLQFALGENPLDYYVLEKATWTKYRDDCPIDMIRDVQTFGRALEVAQKLMSELSETCGQLEGLGEHVTIDNRLKKIPPVLPFFRSENTFCVGDKVVVWRYREEDSDEVLPVRTRVLKVQDDEIFLESRLVRKRMSFESSLIMTAQEYEFYRRHEAYSRFVLEKLGWHTAFRNVLGDIIKD